MEIVNAYRALCSWIVMLTGLPVFGQPSFLQDYGDLDNAKTRVEQLELDHGQNSFILAELLRSLPNFTPSMAAMMRLPTAHLIELRSLSEGIKAFTLESRFPSYKKK